MVQLPLPPVSVTVPVNPAPTHNPAALFTRLPTRVGTTHRLPVGVGVGVAPTIDATSGFRMGAVAVLVSVSVPPKKLPMKGVRNVNGWLTVTLTRFPVPVAKFEAVSQLIDADGADGAKQKGGPTTTTPPPLWPCEFA